MDAIPGGSRGKRPCEAVFDALLQNTSLGMIVIRERRIVLANTGAAAILGYDTDSLMAMNPDAFACLVHPDSREAAAANYRQRMQGGPSPDSYEIHVITRDGTSRWINVFPSLFEFQGKPAVLVTFVDITARVKAIGQLEANEDALRHAIRSLRAGASRDTADSTLAAEEQTRELADTNEYMSTLLSTSHDGILVVDADGQFEYGNEAFFRTFGWPHEELIGAFFMKVIPPDLHNYMMQRWAEVQAGQGEPYETEIIHKDGTRRALLVSHRHMTIAGQRKYCVVTKDITEKKMAERELQAHRERLEELVAERTAELTEANRLLRDGERKLAAAQSIARVGSWEWDTRTGRLQWSEEMYRLLGLEPGKQTAQPDLWDFCHPDDRSAAENVIRNALAKHAAFETELRVVRTNEDTLYVLLRGQPLESRQDSDVWIGTLLDLTERRKLEHEVVEVARREQQRIGQDIHDALGQDLVGLSLLAKALEQRLDKTAPELAGEARRLARMSSDSASLARKLAHGLAPTDIAEGSLSYELQRMAEHIAELHGVECVCSIEGDGRVHDNAVAMHLYYIAREAIANAARHAGASRIDIRLTDGNRACLQVKDNGRWSTATDGPDCGVGLRIMAHRAEIIGGALRIEHGEDRDTLLVCEFPNTRPAG